jgi:hypothetical protein
MESGFSDFIQQVPIGYFITTCLSAVLLVAAMIAIVQARLHRSNTSRATSPPPASASTPPPPAEYDADLPDLDLLTARPAAPPAPEPAPATAARPGGVRSGMHPVQLSDGGQAQAVEVMAIMRDVVDGGLIVQIGDKAYRSLGSDTQFRENFLKVMRELSPLVKGAPPSAAQPAAEPPAAPPPAEPKTTEELQPLRDLMDTKANEDSDPPPPERQRQIPEAPKGVLPGDLPHYSLETQKPITAKTGTGFLRRGKPDFEPVPELNIAGAIEAFLQHKLDYTPEFADREMHVFPAPDGGVRIEVDGVDYDAVDDVTDPAVRQFLRETIAEWQQRH